MTYVLGRERSDAADEAAQPGEEGCSGGRRPSQLVLQEEPRQRRERPLHHVAHRGLPSRILHAEPPGLRSHFRRFE